MFNIQSLLNIPLLYLSKRLTKQILLNHNVRNLELIPGSISPHDISLLAIFGTHVYFFIYSSITLGQPLSIRDLMIASSWLLIFWRI